jgi:hypothetical protein
LFTSADSLPIQLAPVHGRKNPSDSRLDWSRADLFRVVAARSERRPGRSGSRRGRSIPSAGEPADPADRSHDRAWWPPKRSRAHGRAARTAESRHRAARTAAGTTPCRHEASSEEKKIKSEEQKIGSESSTSCACGREKKPRLSYHVKNKQLVLFGGQRLQYIV